MRPTSLATRLMRLVPLLIILALMYYNTKTLGKAFRSMYLMAQSMMVQFELSSLKSSIITYYTGSNKIPMPGMEFDEFVREAFEKKGKRDATKDRFGTKYSFIVYRDNAGRPNGFRIMSAGPDRKFRTADDIVVEWHATP